MQPKKSAAISVKQTSMTRVFKLTWERVPELIAVHVSNEREARSVAAEYLMAMMKIEAVDFCDADILLPITSDGENCPENL